MEKPVGFETLQLRYPWPAEPPNVPEDWHGWLCPDTARTLVAHLGPQTRLVVECGSWLGVSARAILQNAPAACLVCIDTWQGSPEHWAGPTEWQRRLATLHEVCQRNLWPWRDRAAMLRADSLVGLGEVFSLGLKPDLIYLDSKHSLGRVAAELAMCLELFPESPVVGDDFDNAAVKLAAEQHEQTLGRPLKRHGAAFAFPAWRCA